MFGLLPLNKKIQDKVNKYRLGNKFQKQIKLLLENPSHPSLNTELLEPKEQGIYSFRIDLRFRALFIFRPDKNSIEILNIILLALEFAISINPSRLI